MLAKCSISISGIMRKDKGIEAEVAQAKHVKKGRAGRWDTNLLAGADEEYNDLASALGAVRDFHYANTLRWAHGEQALPNERFIAYAKGMGELKGIAEQKLEALKEVWDERVKQAQENSPELTKKFTYPSKSELSGWGATISIGPMPEAEDLILDTSDEEAQKLLNDQKLVLTNLAEERVREAERDLFERLEACLRNASRNLGVGTAGRYREEWYDNLRAFCDSADQMNFNKNPKLTELVDEVKDKVLSTPKDDFNKKENKDSFDTAREEAEEKVNDILSRMQGIF